MADGAARWSSQRVITVSMRGTRLISNQILLIAIIATAASQPTDNELVGQPEIECAGDRVDIQVRTARPFTGKIFVKGHYSQSECRHDYANDTATVGTTAGLSVSHGQCDMWRQRMLQPLVCSKSAHSNSES